MSNKPYLMHSVAIHLQISMIKYFHDFCKFYDIHILLFSLTIIQDLTLQNYENLINHVKIWQDLNQGNLKLYMIGINGHLY